MNNEIKNILGDYQEFFTYLQEHLTELDIDITGKELSHLNYRVQTQAEYEHIRDVLKWYSGEFAEIQFNGRPVSILVLKEPLALAEGFGVSMIEVPSPRKGHEHPTGLEQLVFNIGDELPEFKESYKSVITGIKDRKPYCSPAYITFENGTTASFSERALREVITMQGWGLNKLK